MKYISFESLFRFAIWTVTTWFQSSTGIVVFISEYFSVKIVFLCIFWKLLESNKYV